MLRQLPVRTRRANDNTGTIEELNERRQRLQARAVGAQTQELRLLREQLEEQQRLEGLSIGLLRQQVAQAETSAGTYQQQLSLLQQSQQRQQAQAEEANRYGSLLRSEQNRVASNRASYTRKFVNRERQVARQRPTVGVLTTTERRM